MHLREMSRINMERCSEWHADPNEWSVNDWAVACGGEVGEAMNLCKKLRRMTSGIDSNNNPPDVEECIRLIGKEIADSFWYLDLWCQRLGLDLETVAKHKFDEISEREGLPQRMIPGWTAHDHTMDRLETIRKGNKGEPLSDLDLPRPEPEVPCDLCGGLGLVEWHTDAPRTKPCPNGCKARYCEHYMEDTMAAGTCLHCGESRSDHPVLLTRDEHGNSLSMTYYIKLHPGPRP